VDIKIEGGRPIVFRPAAPATVYKSGGAPTAKIHIRSVGGPVRITVLDHRLRPVDAPMIGEFLKEDAAPGLYLMQYDAGLTSREASIKLEAGEEYKDLQVCVPFPSAAPIPGASGYREAQARAASHLSRSPDPTVALGGGGRLMLFVRHPDPGGAAASLAALALLNQHLQPLVLSLPAHQADGLQGWAGWCADADPGCYVLRWPAQGDAGSTVDQALWVAAGWSTILFLTSGDDGRAPHLADMTIHFAPTDGGFRVDDPKAVDVHLAMELALGGWRTDKPLVDAAALEPLLTGKFSNPMLGIVAAHVLLQEAKPDHNLLTRILAALEAPERIPGCPDVRALRAIMRQRFGLADAVPLLDYPPMFKASFKGAIADDWSRRDVISAGSLAGRVAPCLVPLSPWTTWLTLRYAEATDAPPDDQDATADFLGAWLNGALPRVPVAARVRAFDGGLAPRELWRQFAAWPDPTTRKLAAQLREMVRFAAQTDGLGALRRMNLAGVARALNLPQASVAAAVMRLAEHLLSRPGGSKETAETGAKPGAAWPPTNGLRFIRGEAFGRLLLEVAEQLVRRYPNRDFTDGVAQVFAWFDGKLKQNRRFINGRRFPNEGAFRAYLRQAVWNAARAAERGRRKGRVVRAMAADENLVSTAPGPQQMAMLRESVTALSEPYKSVLEQIFYEESDLAHVAELLGRTRRQAEQLYDEAIDRLSWK
jgi:hypothetical protein